MKNFRLVVLIEIALCAAFAMLLDFIPSIKLSPAISISFKMVPIFIVAFRWGVKAGFVSGLLWGLLKVVTGDAAGGILTPLQGFIEYFIAFAFIGIAGFFQPLIQSSIQEGSRRKAVFWAAIGVFFGSLARYFWHFLAGFIFWGKYAPKGQSAVLYSFIANGTSMIGSFILCAIILGILISMAPILVKKLA
ncbi:energy-coupled thiamine transporter ThiT [Heyndrickxia sp. NPDC080065]|uniref:energy-coupled thiamine transporter ThiT n=1 Tax=Heyndrickxia sp. NPDC080065 TaxID=3390568 RepID=UPI003D03ED36